jgi:hypothetical protein
LTYGDRRNRCEKNFWMNGKWAVVVKCLECNRHQEVMVSDVMDLNGILKKSQCCSCGTKTCLPVLKDHQTLAVIGGQI